MRITLFNVNGRLSSDGSWLITALLKRAGHTVRTVFMPRGKPLLYRDAELAQLHEVLDDADLVMVAVYSSFASRAVQVTDFVHRKYPGMKVIWGGPHCISAPELSLRHADAVCYSEGDQAVVDLVDRMEAGRDYLSTPNFAFKENGSHRKNPTLSPFANLDSLPCPDFSAEGQFLLDGQLTEFSKEKMKDHFILHPFGAPSLWVITSRGCPHRCSYCNNSRYIAMHGRNPMRYHSIDYAIGSLVDAVNYLDFIEFVCLGDDDFLMRPAAQLEDFAEKYKKKVGLPFFVALSANTYRKEKLEILLGAGLKAVQMGVQSGSPRVLDEVYDRKVLIPKTKKVIREIVVYRETHGLQILLDFIIDNPYETRDDIIKTYQYIIDLPLQVAINVFMLVFFPGTPIYERAIKDGIIEPLREESFRFFGRRGKLQYQRNYETFLIFLCLFLQRHKLLRQYTPRFLLRMLGSRPVRAVASIFPGAFFTFLVGISRKI